MSKFRKGQKVTIKHQPDVGVCIVANGKELTDMVRVSTGEPVGFYVRVDSQKHGKNLGYHEASLEKVK